MDRNITRDQLSVGMKVGINPRDDKTRKKVVAGRISEILTTSNAHPYGILVKIDNGREGRVKEILDKEGVINKAEVPSSGITAETPIIELINKGEDHFIEFKTSVLWSKFRTKDEIQSSNSYELKKYGQNTSKYIIAKSICAFLNADGGSLIIGVKEFNDSDKAEVVGIESEYGKLRDKTQDGYRRMILDEIIKPYLPAQVFNHFNDYLRFDFEEINGKSILGIRIKRSDTRVFLHVSNEDIFFVRIDASTRQLTGPELVDYCDRRFAR